MSTKPIRDWSKGSYITEEWNELTTEYEQRLGAALARRPEVKQAAQKTLRKLHEVLTRDYYRYHNSKHNGRTELTIQEAKKRTADVFFMDEPSSAGQIGTGNGLEFMEYLQTDKASVLEIMTAIFNAAFFRSVTLSKRSPSFPFEDVSLQATIHRIFFSQDKPDYLAGYLGLNIDHLSPYTYFLQHDPKLLRKRAEAEATGNKDLEASLRKDALALACIALYRGEDHYTEVLESNKARKWAPTDIDEEGSTTPRYYARLQLPANPMAREYLGSDPRSFELSGFDTADRVLVTELPWDPDGNPDLEFWVRKRGVITAVPHYELRGADVELTEYILVKAQVHVTNIRQADLKKGFAGPEFPVQWREGWSYWGIDPGSEWYKRCREELGYRVVCGISGTAARMLLTFGWLNVGCPASDFIKAIMAWMLPYKDHSLYEIIRAADIAMLDRENERQGILPQGGRKRCLSRSFSDQKFIQSLTDALEIGAESGYQAIEDILLATPGPSPAAPPPPITPHPSTEATYSRKLHNDSFHEITQLRKWEISELLVPCLRSIADYRDPIVPPDPPAPPDPNNPNGHPDDQKFIKERMPYVHNWLGALRINGPDFVRDTPVEHLHAIYAYTSATYRLMNLAQKHPTAALLRESVWELVEGYLRTGKGKTKIPIAFFNKSKNKMLFKNFRQAEDAWRNGSDAYMQKVYLKILKREFDLPDRWIELYQEAHLHTDMASIALDRLPDYNGAAYRGGGCLAGNLDEYAPGQGELLQSLLITKKLTSTSRKKAIAELFAAQAYDPGKTNPAVTEQHLLSGKPIYGLSQAPFEMEILVPKDVPFRRTGDPVEEPWANPPMDDPKDPKPNVVVRLNHEQLF
ncbi:hypothetical protein QZH56_00580 [Streptomyces olivoreticuli]|uniref:hypothetical protein n=1 Tax=Streptomyces olivoreticuli TaxID=68246 RepID=UPI002659A51B|nr:hypothetical protein [Streptomyces olivoreticuli]WKK24217.1 hypothetical protein QZH56_00580 [Streptomyces olivoreticuli]